jgi:hypothetical protein
VNLGAAQVEIGRSCALCCTSFGASHVHSVVDAALTSFAAGNRELRPSQRFKLLHDLLAPGFATGPELRQLLHAVREVELQACDRTAGRWTR